MGRKTGNVNHRQLTMARLVELDFEPIERMVKLAKDETASTMDRFNMAERIASYIYAKPKAIEHSFTADQKVKVTIGGD